MASRQSIDSTHSTAPLIKSPTFQPPPLRYESHDRAESNKPARSINVSTIVLAARILALIAGIVVGTGYSIRGSNIPQVLVLIVLVWVSAAWDAAMVVRGLRHPSLQISLVLSDDRVIRFGGPDEEVEVEAEAEAEDPKSRRKRRCRFPRAFWTDAALVTAVFTLNLVNCIVGLGFRYRVQLSWNWVAITCHIIIALLTASPAVSKAYVRFGAVEMPRVALP